MKVLMESESMQARNVAKEAAFPSSARGERLWRRMDDIWAWLDGWLGRWVSAELNPLAQAGQAANFALLVAVASGVLMLIWYAPSLALAYPSLAALEQGSLGAAARALHRYSSDLVMLLLFAHAFRVFVARKFAGARWLAWVSGVALLGLVWLIGWTGYWLVWDQPAKEVAATSLRFLDALPIFGEPLGRMMIADRLVPSLLFFVVFFFHMLLPLGIALGMVAHLLRLSRVRLMPSWRLGALMTFSLLLASILVPAPLDQAARMAVKPETLSVDAWYLTPLALGMRLQSGGLWLAFGLCLGLGVGIPWILGRRRKPESYQAWVDESRCHACTQCVQDCPFDAISMAARSDGKRFEGRALVDPARCVGCGVCSGSCDSEAIDFAWMRTPDREAEIVKEWDRAASRGESKHIALVAEDVAGAWDPARQIRWQARLEGYQVFFVPTASWARPRFFERLLKRGAEGVLLIGDARAEAAARDGGHWVELRQAGAREPVFRAKRAGGSERWAVARFDPSRPQALERAARDFRAGKSQGRLGSDGTTVGRPVKWLAAGALSLALVSASVGPSHLKVSNPASPDPEFVFAFKAFGAFEEAERDLEAEAKLPAHMRGRSTEKPSRAPVTVRISVDGRTEERVFLAKGFSGDGPALGEWRLALEPGERLISVELDRGGDEPPLRWEGAVQARWRRAQALSYKSSEGFTLEPGGE